MFNYSFNSIDVKGLKVYFVCQKCGANIDDDIENFPYPNLTSDFAFKSSDSIGAAFVCPKCGKEFEYEIVDNMNNDACLYSKDFPEETEVVIIRRAVQ